MYGKINVSSVTCSLFGSIPVGQLPQLTSKMKWSPHSRSLSRTTSFGSFSINTCKTFPGLFNTACPRVKLKVPFSLFLQHTNSIQTNKIIKMYPSSLISNEKNGQQRTIFINGIFFLFTFPFIKK